MAGCQKQWEDIKSTFLRLYQDENKSLDEVRQELAANHQFEASKSAYTKQIKMWRAFKNYKVSDKQRLNSQRISGEQPEMDAQGRPVKWDRIYRATRGQMIIQNRRRNSKVPGSCRAGSMEYRETPKRSVDRPLLHPIDHDSRTLSFVVAIWHQSTLKFGFKDPSASSYHVQRALYNRLMQSMEIVANPAKLQWPKREIDYLCDTIPALVKTQPAMAYDLLTFLMMENPSHSPMVHEKLKDQLFEYIRHASLLLLPQTDPLRCFVAYLHNRETLARLGPLITKAKADTMWKTSKSSGAKGHDERPFFRQVLVGAISILLQYEELQFASAILKEMSDHSPHEPSELAACARVTSVTELDVSAN